MCPIRRFVFLIVCILLSVRLVSQIATNLGTEFWVAFPPNNGAAEISLFISSDVATTGNLVSDFPGVNQPFTVAPGIVTQIVLPAGIVQSAGIENKGIKVSTTDPVAVYGLNRKLATTDAYMALPVTSLGMDYLLLTYNTSYFSMASCLSVVATQDGTTVSVFNRQTGNTSEVFLDEGQTYLVKAPAIGEDLSGSTVSSNFPVAVLGAVQATTIPGVACTAADHIVEQMMPLESWGREFVTVPTAGRDGSGDLFRVLAHLAGTQVSVNGSVVATLGAGEFYQAILTGYNQISATEPVMVAQYAKGMTCSGGTIGDPFMMIIPPREQFLTQYTVTTVSGFTSHWVNLVASELSLGTINEDGILIPSSVFTPIGSSGFYGTQRSITQGSHVYTSAHPFGTFVYGWNTADSYGYAGGMSLSPVATVTNVTLSPPAATGILNVTSVCFTAHVENGSGQPVVGVRVDFHVSGLNPVWGHAYTDNLGNAEFCYTQTGTIPGTDQVYAEVSGNTSNTSTVAWSLTGPCENPETAGSIAGDQSGCPGFVPASLLSQSLPTGYLGNLEYRWQSSAEGAAGAFTDLPASGSPDYSPGPVYHTTWYRRLARVDCMSGWEDAAISNTILVQTYPSPAAVPIRHD